MGDYAKGVTLTMGLDPVAYTFPHFPLSRKRFLHLGGGIFKGLILLFFTLGALVSGKDLLNNLKFGYAGTLCPFLDANVKLYNTYLKTSAQINERSMKQYFVYDA